MVILLSLIYFHILKKYYYMFVSCRVYQHKDKKYSQFSVSVCQSNLDHPSQVQSKGKETGSLDVFNMGRRDNKRGHVSHNCTLSCVNFHFPSDCSGWEMGIVAHQHLAIYDIENNPFMQSFDLTFQSTLEFIRFSFNLLFLFINNLITQKTTFSGNITWQIKLFFQR